MHKEMVDKAKISEFYRRLAAGNPEPRSDLNYTNPYTLLIAVVLSAQSTDAGVNKATVSLFALADSPEKMLQLGEENLRNHIKTIGLFNNKARNIIALSKMLVEKHGGVVPEDQESLENLPGVGHKTANVVLNIIFDKPVIAVDTHIFRVANRTGLAKGKNVAQVEKQLEAITPPEFMRHAHHWLILHGRYICKARKPDCSQCPVFDLCEQVN